MTSRQFILLAGTAKSKSIYRSRSGAGKCSRAPVHGEAGLPREGDEHRRELRRGRDGSVVSRGVTV
jgi:hypothetical protein